MVDPDAPLQMLVTTLGYDDYRGVTAVGRIFAGRIQAGPAAGAHDLARRQVLPERARYLYCPPGLGRASKCEQAEAGEIVAIAGLEGIAIGETLADPDNPVALPPINVEEPTVRMTFGVNTSPFSGREGRWGTSRKLRERLFDELRHNVALRVAETESADTFLCLRARRAAPGDPDRDHAPRGLRVPGLAPGGDLPAGPDGETLEPFEEVHIETSPDTVGVVVEMLGTRRGKMLDMVNNCRRHRAPHATWCPRAACWASATSS